MNTCDFHLTTYCESFRFVKIHNPSIVQEITETTIGLGRAKIDIQFLTTIDVQKSRRNAKEYNRLRDFVNEAYIDCKSPPVFNAIETTMAAGGWRDKVYEFENGVVVNAVMPLGTEIGFRFMSYRYKGTYIELALS